MLHKVLLSPIDQFMPSRHIRVILAFSNSDPKLSVASLNLGLEATCAQIPYLKGSVYQSDQQAYLGVAWSDDDTPVRLQEISAFDGMPTFAELDAEDMTDRGISASSFPPVVEETRDSDLRLAVFRVSYTIIRGGLLL